jgi:UDP-N-acetylmuramoylalanine--D-glutamate ligase
MRVRDYFMGKRIAVIGIGPHGEMLADIRFMVKASALVSVCDLRNEARLGAYMGELRAMGLANCIAGSVPADDLLDMDLIILSHEYPRTSSFLADARKKGIEIEYPETLFLKLAPPVMVVGIMGSCGKTTVMSMLAPLLEAASAAEGVQSSFSVDPESGGGMLTHLRRMKSGDVVALRITEPMMHEIRSLNWSPQVAIFTSVPGAASYESSPFEILKYQTYTNYVIGSDHVIDALRVSDPQVKAKMLRTKPSIVPEDWLRYARTAYDREDASLALQAARIFKVSDDTAHEILAVWKPLKGRLEPLKKVKGVDFVNDTASVSPAATIAAMSALAKDRDLVLIIGGADKGADCKELYPAIARSAHTVVVLPGSGTMRERQELRKLEGVSVISAPSLEEAVRQAFDHAHKGGKVVFSPGFEAGGMDGSRTERGERFVRAVRAL